MAEAETLSGKPRTEVARLLSESVLSITREYASQPEVLKVGGVTIGTQGNFSASIGKAKSKKTFNVSAIAAAALGRKPVLGYTVSLPPDRDTVLYVDTEQSSFHCQAVMRRIMLLAGVPVDEDCQRLVFISLRKFTPEQRVKLVEEAVRTIPRIGLVIIDGVRDFLVDINSPTEATNVTSRLMRWTDEHQFHLHTILHQNKGDENARGHIGTELNNKAEAVMLVEKDKEDDRVSIVSPVHTRQESFGRFAFRINDDGLLELVDDYNFEKPKVGRPSGDRFDPATDLTDEEHRQAVGRIFAEGTEDLSYNSLQSAIKETYSEMFAKIGDNKAVEILKFLKEAGYVEQRNGRKYSMPRRRFVQTELNFD